MMDDVTITKYLLIYGLALFVAGVAACLGIFLIEGRYPVLNRIINRIVVGCTVIAMGAGVIAFITVLDYYL
jgi:hypothetical protein